MPWARFAIALLAVALAGRPLARVPSASPRAQHKAAGSRASPGRAAPRPTLESARALLAAVKRDPAKRRYRHNWEKAIRALTLAARGRAAPAALLEAARARYALYRFSAIEADRDKALSFAARAARAGSREAPAFAAAVRREAGDEPENDRRNAKRRAIAKRGPSSRVAQPPAAVAAALPTPIPSPAPEPPVEEPLDPILERAVSDLAGSPGPVADEKTPEVTPGPARVSEVKSWTSPEYTRVAIYLSKHVEVENQELAPAEDRPRRLALDLKPALLEGKVLARPVGGAQVERVRAAQRDPETVRVVLDLAGSDGYQLFSLDDPPSLIVDVGGREAQGPAQAAAPPEPQGRGRDAAERRPPESPGEGENGEAERRTLRRVVLDAGHGGHDSGAIGPSGAREKDVTLAMAKRLARRLEAAGLEVVLTRREDRYLQLWERTAIANAARGDLFVSLHANAHPRRDRRGAETYFLNVADDRYAARLAARENGLLPDEAAADRQVRRIRSDLDVAASAPDSQRLARLVQHEICAGIRQRVGEVRDLGVKSALFYVLLGARMPAVLVETAFISNRIEERRLVSRAFQEEVADDLARAILSFAGRQPRLAAAR